MSSSRPAPDKLSRFMRPLGMFLIVVAGLAALDWVVGMAIFGWPHNIYNVEYYGLRAVYQPPLPRTLIFLPCPGNGYGFLCGPWLLFLVFVTLLVSAVCLVVNLIYFFTSLGNDIEGSVSLKIPAQVLFAGTSLALALGLLWTWSIPLVPRSWGLPTGTPLTLKVVSSFLPLLFILVSVATGWRCLGGRTNP